MAQKACFLREIGVIVEKIRIQKMIADSGYCSRRKAEELMEKGRVRHHGHPVKPGGK